MKPAPPKWTEEVRLVFSLANDEAAQSGQKFIWPEHFLLGMLRERHLAGTVALERLGVRLREARHLARESLRAPRDEVITGRLPLHPYSRRATRRAATFAAADGADAANDVHLLLALIENPRRPVGALLRRMQIDPKSLQLLLKHDEKKEAASAEPLAYDSSRPSRRSWWPFRK
jgi:ATP-dependent Clp protease ATP-binding subunit ClpA